MPAPFGWIIAAGYGGESCVRYPVLLGDGPGYPLGIPIQFDRAPPMVCSKEGDEAVPRTPGCLFFHKNDLCPHQIMVSSILYSDQRNRFGIKFFFDCCFELIKPRFVQWDDHLFRLHCCNLLEIFGQFDVSRSCPREPQYFPWDLGGLNCHPPPPFSITQ